MSNDDKPNNFNRKIASGLLWNSIMVMVSQGSSILVKLILARLLVPEYFGLVGMAVVFTGLFKVINDSGFKPALIQRKSNQLNDTHFSTVFWFSILFSLALFTLVIFGIAPFTVWFYNEPELYTVTIALSVALLINPLNLIHRVILTRELNFKKIATATSTATVIASLISIILALLGAGIWSIVFQSVAIPLITVPFLWGATKWKPKFIFSISALRSIFNFSIYTMGTSIIYFFRNNVDYLLIGKLLSPHAVGLYTIVFLITETTRSKIYSIINKVMFPIYSKIQDDKLQLKQYYLSTTKYNAIVTFPFFVFLMFFSYDILNIFIGELWIDAAFSLSILSLASIIFAIAGTPSEILKAIGKPKYSFRIMLFNTLLIAIPLLYAGITYFGINGAAVATLIHITISRITFQKYMNKFIGVNIQDIARVLVLPLYASLIPAILIKVIIIVLEINIGVYSFIFITVLFTTSYFAFVYVKIKNEIINIYKMSRDENGENKSVKKFI
ncbi:lipopolysaccharide biosynthesis protein [Alkalicoccus chagannorensis]|uniref:lipopolysaccharide biosynthesis protein n=1 Tax=Alkalicoccus chagannorensis TaxID=427072 RepID=UPI0004207930|nr:lipopolysaccharide biosynthesis protein [Alkalicoccus chagannorensis]